MHEPDKLPDEDSKTQRKKQMLALQDIGKILVELPAPQLAKIPLEHPLSGAIAEARRLKSHEAKRRQLQYIGKLMRNVDVEPITQALNKVQLKGQLNKAKFHQVERWRDKLIAEGDTIVQEFVKQFPKTNSQHLRQLIRKSQQDAKTEKNTGADTALFRYLHSVIEDSI
jgi:ribosome-associated protein